MDVIFDIAGAAEYLHIKKWTLYRLAKKGSNVAMRDCVIDCKDAIRYLAKNSESLGIDPMRICVMGDSAGGHIAQMLLLASPEQLPGDPALAKSLTVWLPAFLGTVPAILRKPICSITMTGRISATALAPASWGLIPDPGTSWRVIGR